MMSSYGMKTCFESMLDMFGGFTCLFELEYAKVATASTLEVEEMVKEAAHGLIGTWRQRHDSPLATE